MSERANRALQEAVAKKRVEMQKQQIPTQAPEVELFVTFHFVNGKWAAMLWDAETAKCFGLAHRLNIRVPMDAVMRQVAAQYLREKQQEQERNAVPASV